MESLMKEVNKTVTDQEILELAHNETFVLALAVGALSLQIITQGMGIAVIGWLVSSISWLLLILYDVFFVYAYGSPSIVESYSPFNMNQTIYDKSTPGVFYYGYQGGAIVTAIGLWMAIIIVLPLGIFYVIGLISHLCNFGQERKTKSGLDPARDLLTSYPVLKRAVQNGIFELPSSLNLLH